MRKLFFLGTILLSLASCEKTSSQLPKPEVQPYRLVKPIKISGSHIIDLIFTQIRSSTGDTVHLSLKNITNKKITSIIIAVEYCNDSPHSFESCILQTEIKIDSINENGYIENIFDFIDQDFQLNEENINIYLLGYQFSDGKQQPNTLSGIYRTGLLKFFDTSILNLKDTSGNDSIVNSNELMFYGASKGIIQVDGSFTFRVRSESGLDYNLIGQFIDTANLINGLIYESGDIKSEIYLAYSKSKPTLQSDASTQSLSFGLYLEKPITESSIDSIAITSLRN